MCVPDQDVYKAKTFYREQLGDAGHGNANRDPL